METLFQEYEPEKPILSIGQYALVKYQKKEKQPEDKEYEMMRNKNPVIYGESLPQGLPYVKKKRGITNKRQYALKEIQNIIESENGGKINANVLAMKLSHVPTEDLYFMKSSGLDYRHRTGKPFAKYIYGSIKVK